MRRKAYVDVSPTPAAPDFFGEISYTRYTDFALSLKRANGEKVHRSSALISRGTEDAQYLYVLFQRHGTGVITQAGHTAEVRPGQVVIYDSAQPFSLDYKQPYEQVVVHLCADRAFADAGLRPSSDLLAVPIAVDGALSSVNTFFLNLAVTQASDPVGAELLAPHAATLASSLLAYAARTRSADDMPALLQRERALSYMRQHLSDPDLDADRIAVGCHVSRRTLYRLFQSTGQTVASHLRTMRVDAARRLLAGQADLSVESVAREVGFTNDSHFYRSFRFVTGVTPGEYRQMARQGSQDLRARAERTE
jgi:AraC-like DNA-binding protein